MSRFEATKLRNIEHYELGSAGSYCATVIDVVGTCANGSTGTTPRILVSNQTTGATPWIEYNQLTAGWHFMVWSYAADSEGFPLTLQYNQYGLSANALALQLALANDGHFGPQAIWAISSVNEIEINQDLVDKLRGERSRSVTVLEPYLGVTDLWSYAAIGTSSLGVISEQVSKKDATAKFHLEGDDWDKIGWAGYGYNLLDSQYLATTSYLGSASLQCQSTNNTTGTAGAHNIIRGSEWVRVVGLARIGDDAARSGGSVRLVANLGNGSAAQTVTSNDWVDIDIWVRTSTGAWPQLSFNVIFSQGSVIDAYGAQLKNMQIFKAGFSHGIAANAVHNAMVSGHTITGRDITNSVAAFHVNKPSEFLSFWSSDRNLAPTNLVKTSYGNTSEGVRWFDTSLNLSNTSDTQKAFSYSFNNIGSNSYFQESLTTSGKYIDVDSSKFYFAGFWVRVHDFVGGTNATPNRISVLVEGLNSSNQVQSFRDYTGTLRNTTNLPLVSVGAATAQGAGADSMGWKLYGGFFLPHWMTPTELTSWKEDVVESGWAGDFDLSVDKDDADSFTQSTPVYGQLQNASWIAGMNSSVDKINATLLTEIKAGSSCEIRVAYPFFCEVDPLNISENGDLYFLRFIQDNYPD